MTSLDVVPVLLYHRIGAAGDRFTVDPPAFRRHVAFLADRLSEGWRAVSIATLGAALRDRTPLPPRVFCVTFDDGFADTAPAMETLGGLGIPSTVYAVPSFVGRPGMLTARDLGRLSRSSWGEVGAHSLTHPWMDELTPQEAYQEAIESRRWLEHVLGAPVTTFAYPHGAHSAQTRDAVIRAGYSSACAVKNAWSHASDDPYAIARWTLTRSSDAEELGRLFAGAAPRAWARERLRTRGWRTARRLRRRVARAIR
jgi:peptidoglycan/xylan/chitin deacetylase (PgdA/CDA1 family)